MPLTGTYNGYARQMDGSDMGEHQDLKRILDADAGHPNKKMRMDDLASGVVQTVTQMA